MEEIPKSINLFCNNELDMLLG